MLSNNSSTCTDIAIIITVIYIYQMGFKLYTLGAWCIFTVLKGVNLTSVRAVLVTFTYVCSSPSSAAVGKLGLGCCWYLA